MPPEGRRSERRLKGLRRAFPGRQNVAVMAGIRKGLSSLFFCGEKWCFGAVGGQLGGQSGRTKNEKWADKLPRKTVLNGGGISI